MKLRALLASVFVLCSCSHAPLRATVDSYGEERLDRSLNYSFNLKNLTLLEKQAAQDCGLAAKEAQLKIMEQTCADCIPIELHTRLVGTEQVVRSSPGFGSSFGFFGGGGLGLGIGTGSNVRSSPESQREINLIFYADSMLKKNIREIQVRSAGRENSVSAVAYEMCQAAFRDFPQNVKGKYYEVKFKEE